ncbi:transcription initiation factor TFIIH subunit 1 [Blastomyces dermatitidis ATCC 26199]|nr:transcription initiation factor TFIIH subunit 1 [Blastomyces dermatitidis ATCC 26199]
MAARVESQAVAYKKKDGSLTMASDGQSITWAPKGSSSGLSPVTIKVADITHLQQTPATSPKVMLKVFVQVSNAGPSPSPHKAPPGATEQYIFPLRPDQTPVPRLMRSKMPLAQPYKQ